MSDKLRGNARRHYTHDEVARLAVGQGLDIMLTHDAPAGVRYERRWRGGSYVRQTAGLDAMLGHLRPSVCFFGHHLVLVDAEVSGVRCIGLNKVGYPGSLVAIEFESKGREWSVIGEYS